MDIEKATETIQALTRPLVTIVFTLTLSWGFIAGKVAGEAYLPLAALIMGFWFQQRQAEKENVANKAADKLVEKMTAPQEKP
jgi:hypothetical protein